MDEEMKLSKDDIIDAANAFNSSSTFDEFKVQLDLRSIKLEDFEKDYYAVASIHPIFKNIITCNGKIDAFNSNFYMDLDPNKIFDDFEHVFSNRLMLPLWFEKNDDGTVKMMMPNHRYVNASYSSELKDILASYGIDVDKELAQTMIIELRKMEHDGKI